MSRPTVDQASKQNLVVNIQDSEFGKLVVQWCERDNILRLLMLLNPPPKAQDDPNNLGKILKLLNDLVFD